MKSVPMSTAVFFIVVWLGADPHSAEYSAKAALKPAGPFSLVYETRSLLTSSLEGKQGGRIGSWRVSSKSPLHVLLKLKLLRNQLIFVCQGRNVHCCKTVSVHVVDSCKVVDVCRIVEKPDGIIWDKVPINHGKQFERSYCWIWNWVKKNIVSHWNLLSIFLITTDTIWMIKGLFYKLS